MSVRYEKYTERKFLLSLLFSIGGTAGLLLGALDGTAYGLLAGAVLGGYGWNKKVAQGGSQ